MKKYKYIFIIILIILAIFGWYYVFGKDSSLFGGGTISPKIDLNNLASTSLPVSPDLAKKISKPADPPAGYVEYVNSKYTFSFYHSPLGKITEYDQGQGAMIITLENEQKVRGMQIFIVPYWEDTISEERFKSDVKSGVRTNVEKSEVDGVEAVTFNSVDEYLGATREVWVIRGGYLYEITTFQGVGNWFVPIMQTWRFY